MTCWVEYLQTINYKNLLGIFICVFPFKVCGARVKTQGTLMTHRKKVHKLNTALPLTSKLVPDTLIQQGHDDVSMATVTVAGAPTHTVVATMSGEGQQPAIIAHHKMATLIEASDIQHATTSDGTAVLLIKVLFNLKT